MKNNYSTYHLHELHRALATVDEKENPEEARIIREQIAQGGYQYPDGTARAARSVFTSTLYKYSLVALLVVSFLINTGSLLMGDLVALLPMALQAVLLFMIYTQHKAIRVMLKVWAILVMVLGSLSLFSALHDAYSSSYEVVYSVMIFSIGLLFFILANTFIKLVPENDASNPDAHEQVK